MINKAISNTCDNEIIYNKNFTQNGKDKKKLQLNLMIYYIIL